MAIPASGSLSICATAGSCRSISTAVGTGSGSLAALSTSAGKSAPHGMTEFYNYSPATPINWVQYASVGTNGSSTYLTRAYCASPTPVSGSYTICIRGHMFTGNQQSGSYGGICVTCNFTVKMACCITTAIPCATPSVAFLVGSTDCVRVYTCACATNSACSLCVCVHNCLISVTGTGYEKGTTCVDGIIWTA